MRRFDDRSIAANARYIYDDAHPYVIGSGSWLAFQALTLAIRNSY